MADPNPLPETYVDRHLTAVATTLRELAREGLSGGIERPEDEQFCRLLDAAADLIEVLRRAAAHDTCVWCRAEINSNTPAAAERLRERLDRINTR